MGVESQARQTLNRSWIYYLVEARNQTLLKQCAQVTVIVHLHLSYVRSVITAALPEGKGTVRETNCRALDDFWDMSTSRAPGLSHGPVYSGLGYVRFMIHQYDFSKIHFVSSCFLLVPCRFRDFMYSVSHVSLLARLFRLMLVPFIFLH